MICVAPPIPLHCTFRSLVNLIPRVFPEDQSFRSQADVSCRHLSKGFFNRLVRFLLQASSQIASLKTETISSVCSPRSCHREICSILWLLRKLADSGARYLSVIAASFRSPRCRG